MRGSSATFALVAKLAPAEKVGAVGGVVGAAGGLGGFVPPLVMGLVYGLLGSYRLGLALLALVALGTAAIGSAPAPDARVGDALRTGAGAEPPRFTANRCREPTSAWALT